MLRDKAGNRRINGFLIADVQHHVIAAPADRGDLLDHLLERFFATPGHHGRGSQRRHFVSDATSDPAASAGDQKHLAVEKPRPKDAVEAISAAHDESFSSTVEAL